MYDNSAFGQVNKFKTYSDEKNKFSFEIPSQWTIKENKEITDSNIISTCRPTSKNNSYEECFDGIVFYIILYKNNLERTLEEDGSYKKYGIDYYTTDRVTDSLKTINIKGLNWTGIYHNNTCGISCKETGFHAAAGQCEFYYFSSGQKTICITTTGRQLDDNVKAKLLETFRFN